MLPGKAFISDIINSIVASNVAIMKKFDLKLQLFPAMSDKTLKATIPNIGIVHESGYDPSIGRKLFWEKRFGAEPLPHKVKDASIKFAGSMAIDMHVTDEDVQNAINAADNA